MKYIKNRNDKEITNNSTFKVPLDILELNEVFKKNNYKLYIVGGALRDFLVGDIPKDYDLCTDALPDEVVRILSPHYKIQEQGKAFGVVVVYTNQTPEGMEIATFREDISKGRNPEVNFCDVTIEDDCNRRDLSINAMFYDIQNKEIIDLVGGQKDLENGIIRMVGNAVERIEEDSLRILRVFRFASRYGSKLDTDTIKGIHLNNDISSVSMERIWDSENGEFMKSFRQAKDFQQYLDFITEFNLWEQLLPGLKVIPKIKNKDNIVLVITQLIFDNDINLIKKILTKCAIPNVIISQVIFLINILNFKAENVVKHYKEKIKSSIDNNTILAWLKINNRINKDITNFLNYSPTVNGEEVMKRFNLKPSKELGDKINELEVELFKSI